VAARRNWKLQPHAQAESQAQPDAAETTSGTEMARQRGAGERRIEIGLRRFHRREKNHGIAA